MKRLLLLSAKTTVRAFMLLGVVLVLTDAVWEARGIPDWGANFICAAFAERGISLHADNIRAGLARGVVIEQARVRLDWQGMPLLVNCREIQLRAQLSELILGRFQVRELSFTGAGVALYFGPVPAVASTRTALRLERCSGLARRQRDGVVGLTVGGMAEKISVHLEAEIRGLEATPFAGAGTSPTAGAQPTRPGTTQRAERRPSAETYLARVSDLLKTCPLSERDAYLSGKLVVDLQQPQDLRFDGEIGLAEIVLGDLLVSRFKSGLHYQHSEIRLASLNLILGRDETISGDVVLDLAAQRLSGRVKGHVYPYTLWRFQSTPPPDWLEHVQTPVPLDVTMALEPSPLAPSQWQMRAEVVGRNLQFTGLAVSQFRAGGTWNGQDLTVENWRADLDPRGTEFAEGRFTWHRVDGTLEGEGTLRANLDERVIQANLPAVTQALRRVDFPAPVTLQVSLPRSPPDWRRWRGSVTLATDSVRVWDRTLTPVKLVAHLDAGVIDLETLTAGCPEAPADVLAVTATLDLAQAIDSGTWQVLAEVRGKAILEPAIAGSRTPPATAWQEAVVLRGMALFTPATGSLDVAAEGTAYPDRWYATFVPRIGLPASHIARDIRSALGAPACIMLTATRPDRSRPPRLSASVSAAGARYADLEFRTVQGDLEVSRDMIEFTGLSATTTAGDDLTVDQLRIDFEPLAVTICNARVIGNPELAQTFIDDREGKAIYRSVWRDFRWTPGHPATIDLHQLVYQQGAGRQAWTLTLDADLRAAQASYRDLPVQRLAAKVLLDLPDSVVVRDARVETDAATVEGDVTILTGKNPTCSFKVRQVQGGQDPRRILRLLNPEWDAALSLLSFSPESAVDCGGSFHLSGEPMLQLSGTLSTPYCIFRGLRVDEPRVQWRLRQSAVHWNLTSGRLFGGPIALTGVYDVEDGSGTVAFRGDAMVLKDVAAQFGLSGMDLAQEGAISAHCRLQILRGWAGRDLQVYGDGNLSITQADLWRVPLFNTLGRLLDVSFLNRITGGKTTGLGRITRLDAELGLNGDRMIVRSLTTDGTIVSLRGNGEYCWETDRINLAVSGETLDRAGLVGWIFKPLSWAFFNAELTGTSKDNKWRLSTVLSKVLPGSSGGNSGDALEPLPEP
jgi:hypothetical protein